MLTIALTILGYRAVLAVVNTGPAGSWRAKIGRILGNLAGGNGDTP